jgi:hypothetical protein
MGATLEASATDALPLEVGRARVGPPGEREDYQREQADESEGSYSDARPQY